MKDATMTIGWRDGQRKTRDTQRQKSLEFRAQYEAFPKLCECCESPIAFDKRANKFCSRSCSATVNNTLFHKRKLTSKAYTPSQRKKIRNARKKFEGMCKICGDEFSSESRTTEYCSLTCSSRRKTLEIHSQIEAGTYTSLGHQAYRKYLIEKYGARCMMCAWDKTNPTTQKCPIELDHIDGNSENNILENLRLLCPNCHSLQSTYKSLNKGNGRFSRSQRYKNGKSY